MDAGLRANNAFDFDDLLSAAVALLQHSTDLRPLLQDKFRRARRSSCAVAAACRTSACDWPAACLLDGWDVRSRANAAAHTLTLCRPQERHVCDPSGAARLPQCAPL